MFCTPSRAVKAIVAVFILCFILTASTPHEWVVEETIHSGANETSNKQKSLDGNLLSEETNVLTDGQPLEINLPDNWGDVKLTDTTGKNGNEFGSEVERKPAIDSVSSVEIKNAMEKSVVGYELGDSELGGNETYRQVCTLCYLNIYNHKHCFRLTHEDQ